MNPTTSNPGLRIATPAPPKEVEFKRADPAAAPKRLVLSVDGEAKTGKTHFCLTAPGPMAYHDLNLGLEGVLNQFPDLEVYPFYYDIPVSAALPGSAFTSLTEPARKTWEQLVRNYRASLEKMHSVVLDDGTGAWELCRLARLGKLAQVLPIQYAAVNAEFRQLSQLALIQRTCNVIYTHKMKAVYKNEQKTEEKERAGFGEIEYDVQAVIRTHRDTTKAGLEQFAITIEECRPRMEATGTRFVGSDCTFTRVATAIYPGTTEDYWRG